MRQLIGTDEDLTRLKEVQARLIQTIVGVGTDERAPSIVIHALAMVLRDMCNKFPDVGGVIRAMVQVLLTRPGAEAVIPTPGVPNTSDYLTGSERKREKPRIEVDLASDIGQAQRLEDYTRRIQFAIASEFVKEAQAEPDKFTGSVMSALVLIVGDYLLEIVDVEDRGVVVAGIASSLLHTPGSEETFAMIKRQVLRAQKTTGPAH